MEIVTGLVSVVIPAYNAEEYFLAVIHSILSQTYIQFEVLIVNDGSTDKTVGIAAAFNENRIRLINLEKNMGVSNARNIGLLEAQGEYICFFDADDLMTPEFLSMRVNVLSQKKNIGFVGGMVWSFPGVSTLQTAVAKNPEQEIHFFEKNMVTIPSNYLFRTSVIRDNHIIFNSRLNSSADRFFLLQLAKFTKGEALLNQQEGCLMYRVKATSMSHLVNHKLSSDYYEFYKELKSKNLFPARKRKEIQSRYLFSIALSFSHVRHWKFAMRLFLRSFFTQPLIFLNLVFKKIFSNSNKNAKQ
jgi:glycosyltransferase involved in cell wall biosynthesis